MPARHPRTSALLLGAALVLTAASPAAASQEQPATSTAGSGVAPPTQQTQQDGTARLALRTVNASNPDALGPARPGGQVRFSAVLVNDGQEIEEYVLTFTLPPELTLLRLNSIGAQVPEGCSGSVCRGVIGPGATIENQIFAGGEGSARLSSSFRGDATTIRADLQAGANPDPSKLTGSITVAVAQPAAGAPSSGTTTGTGGAGSTATALTELPRTGERTDTTALVAVCLLLLGAMAQLGGTRRRPATHGG